MQAQLVYRQQPDEGLRFRHTTSMIVDDPVVGRSLGRVVNELEYREESESDAGGWVMSYRRHLVNAEGRLCEQILERQRTRELIYRLTPDGQMFDLGHGVPGRQPVFPPRPVGVGDAWNAADPPDRPDLPPFTVTYSLIALERREGDLQADLVALGEAHRELGDQSVLVAVEGVVTFSVDRGRVLRSVEKITMTWPSITPDSEAPRRRVRQTSIELEPLL